MDPVVGPGVTSPLAFDLLADLETPEWQKLGYETQAWCPYSMRYWGVEWPASIAATPARVELERGYTYTFPGLHPERIVYGDRLRCVDVPPATLAVAPQVWELARIDLAGYGLGTIERIGTVFDEITALDAQGAALLTFGNLNGERPCLSSLTHPDPLVLDPLLWAFRLVVTDVPEFFDDTLQILPPLVAAPLSDVDGVDLVEPWADLRNGFAFDWSDHKQYLTPRHQVARLLVVLSGTPDRWRITVGGRLSGYFQAAGFAGAAARAAVTRTY